MSETIEKMDDEERRIRAAELMGWKHLHREGAWIDRHGKPRSDVWLHPTKAGSAGFVFPEHLPNPDHCLDDAVKLAEACGLKAELRTPSGKYPASARVWADSAEWGVWIPDPSLTRALTSAVLKAMEEKQ